MGNDATDEERSAGTADASSQAEQEAVEHTEKTGEVLPSSNWPTGDPDVKIPT